MLNLEAVMLSLGAGDTVPSTSNLISYILLFVIIGAFFAVFRVIVAPRKGSKALEAPPLSPQISAAPAPAALIGTELIAAAVAAAHSYLKIKRIVAAAAAAHSYLKIKRALIGTELIAAAVAAAHSYLKMKETAYSSQPQAPKLLQSAWVLSERMNPSFGEDPYFREKKALR